MAFEPMSNRRRLATWIALIASFVGAIYMGMNVISYAWLNASAPNRWPAERAEDWALGAMAIAVLLLGVSVYCAMVLKRNAGRRTR